MSRSRLCALLAAAGPALGWVRGGGLAAQAAPPEFHARALSAFAAAKARTLIRERLPCLGCHRLDAEGGRIGPDLSAPAPGTTAAFIYAMVRDPQRSVPGGRMPRTPLAPETLELVASYLAQRVPAGKPAGARAPGAATRAPAAPSRRSAKELYGSYCAACHGAAGNGDGYNAAFLPVRPAVHADPRAMSERSDDQLFDAIAAGGYVLSRSNRMPGFGQTLTVHEIRALVGYIRELCRCQGPAWSRDDATAR
ncbi:MAG TPA: c-type cytochrome [Gemmatimonadales bacterium]|nr:c-type cytochrome [Gemmatimonadales bacterium]